VIIITALDHEDGLLPELALRPEVTFLEGFDRHTWL
jgi:hypothetical protein